MLTAIVLAAGKASRMGTLKQLLPWGEGTILEVVLGAVLACPADDEVRAGWARPRGWKPSWKTSLTPGCAGCTTRAPTGHAQFHPEGNPRPAPVQPGLHDPSWRSAPDWTRADKRGGRALAADPPDFLVPCQGTRAPGPGRCHTPGKSWPWRKRRGLKNCCADIRSGS